MGRDMYAHPEHEKPSGVGMSGQNMDGSGRAFKSTTNSSKIETKKPKKEKLKKGTTIAEAKKICDKLKEEIDIIEKEYAMADGYAEYIKRQKQKPFYDKMDNLLKAIKKAEEETEI
jgi:hypothetical protein